MQAAYLFWLGHGVGIGLMLVLHLRDEGGYCFLGVECVIERLEHESTLEILERIWVMIMPARRLIISIIHEQAPRTLPLKSLQWTRLRHSSEVTVIIVPFVYWCWPGISVVDMGEIALVEIMRILLDGRWAQFCEAVDLHAVQRGNCCVDALARLRWLRRRWGIPWKSSKLTFFSGWTVQPSRHSLGNLWRWSWIQVQWIYNHARLLKPLILFISILSVIRHSLVPAQQADLAVGVGLLDIFLGQACLSMKSALWLWLCYGGGIGRVLISDSSGPHLPISYKHWLQIHIIPVR